MGEPVVVVGVDGSPASYTALRWVLAHAARIGAQVRAVRCWTPIVAKRWKPRSPVSQCHQKPSKKPAPSASSLRWWRPHCQSPRIVESGYAASGSRSCAMRCS
ncbi:MAG TPA: universal stress protein [Pseudonocardiaceae bacterium]